ncbi:hypothetical protein ACFSUK_07940 [Sphingobium scionense]|uniref:Uncharacterized protein n=1 Tax=Sphingobium scionense TaxID=1404341 RepID=A0A7W6LRB9_9SPHN|nr:hypothetical protein [Sphingobium scionense]MBB4149086.1 hypothetical protein [Sphingobium scionense]
MSLDYIRQAYRVPAYPRRRIRYTGGHKPCLGTIEGASSAHLLVRLDGMPDALPYHPTWEIEYLDPAAAEGGHAL